MEYGLVVQWWLVFVVLLVAGLPITASVLPQLADRGAGVALPMALAIMTIVAYWIGQISFGFGSVLISLAVLSGIVLVSRRRWRSPIHVTASVDSVIVFTVAYLLMIATRAVDPAISPTGGEKFLDFGMLNTLLRSSTLPPTDFWFAGEPVQYYYGGHMIAALLTELTGTPPEVAYNLALAGFYAMTVTAAFGLAGSIAADFGHSRRLAGGVAGFMVGFGSNLLTPLRTAFWLLPDAIATIIETRLAYEPVGTALGPDHFFYWDASRIIEGTINEFPLFAFLNGDLHAHMMSMPFVVLTAAVGYGYFRTPETNILQRRVLMVGAMPLVIGLLSVINTWDLPIGLGLAGLALVFAPASAATLLPHRMARVLPEVRSRHRVEVLRFGIAIAFVGVITILSIIWASPFFAQTASVRGIGLFPNRSGLGDLFVVHGGFLLVFWAYLIDRGFRIDRRLTLLGLGLSGIILAIGWRLNVAAIGLFAPLLIGGWILLRPDGEIDGEQTRPVGYETVLLIAGLGLVLIVEFAYVRELAGPERLNTVFKTYAQVWLFWSIAAGVMIAALLRRQMAASSTVIPPKRRSKSFAPWRSGLPKPRRVLVTIGVALVLVSMSLYGALALTYHFDHAGEDRTLDGMKFVEDEHPEEAAAIAWLAAHDGQPHIVSAPGTEMYRWVNAPSSLTGIPTVAGWAHQRGYRSADVYDTRVAHVDGIYTGTTEERRALLSLYDVTFVYIGPVERERYGDEIREFGHLDGITIAFEDEDVTIYEIDRSR